MLLSSLANNYALVMEVFPVFGQVERKHTWKNFSQIIKRIVSPPRLNYPLLSAEPPITQKDINGSYFSTNYLSRGFKSSSA